MLPAHADLVRFPSAQRELFRLVSRNTRQMNGPATRVPTYLDCGWTWIEQCRIFMPISSAPDLPPAENHLAKRVWEARFFVSLSACPRPSWFGRSLELAEEFAFDPCPNGRIRVSAYWRTVIGDRLDRNRDQNTQLSAMDT
jgi:hypothetical protein